MEGIRVSVSQSESNQDVSIVKISGYIDTTTSSELERILQNLLREQKFKIVVDLKNVEYISSAGWGIFISEIKNIRVQHGDLKLACMTESVNEVYELLEFSTILSSSDSVEDAVNLFSRGTKPSMPTAASSANRTQRVLQPSAASGFVAPLAAKPSEVQAAYPEPVKSSAPVSATTDTNVHPAGQPAAKELEPSRSSMSLMERIKEIIKSHPEWGAWKIKNELNRTRGKQSKVGWGEVRAMMKYSNLNSKASRYHLAQGL